MNDSKETVDKIKDQAPEIDIDSLIKRLEDVEEQCTQLEATLKDTVTFETLAVRLTGQRTVKKKTS